MLGLVRVGRMRISRWIGGGEAVLEGRIKVSLDAARAQLGVTRPVSIVESPGVPTPLTVGTFHPMLLLPTGLASRLSETELDAVVLHETAHVKRNDPLLLTAASLLRALLYFHPLVWLAARQIANLAEAACDDAVLDAGDEPVSYAKLLARLAGELRFRPLTAELSAGVVLARSALLQRVEAILSGNRDRIKRVTRRALVGIVVAAIASLGAALLVPLGERPMRIAAAAEAKRKERPTEAAEAPAAGVQRKGSVRTPNTPSPREPADLLNARLVLEQLRSRYADNHPKVRQELRRIEVLEASLRRGEPDDLRAERAELAELEMDYGENHPKVREALRRIEDIEASVRRRKSEALDPIVEAALMGSVYPAVAVRITSIRRDGAIVIPFGSEDGLKKADRLLVHDDNGEALKYVSEIEAVDVSATRTVCREVPHRERGAIKVGQIAVPKDGPISAIDGCGPIKVIGDLSPAETASCFVAAAFLGYAPVVSTFSPLDQPVADSIKPFREIAKVNPAWSFEPGAVLMSAKQDAALVVARHSIVVQQPTGFDRGQLCFELCRQDGRWRIADVDFENEEGVAKKLAQFRKQHPDAQVEELTAVDRALAPMAKTKAPRPKKPVRHKLLMSEVQIEVPAALEPDSAPMAGTGMGRPRKPDDVGPLLGEVQTKVFVAADPALAPVPRTEMARAKKPERGEPFRGVVERPLRAGRWLDLSTGRPLRPADVSSSRPVVMAAKGRPAAMAFHGCATMLLDNKQWEEMEWQMLAVDVAERVSQFGRPTERSFGKELGRRRELLGERQGVLRAEEEKLETVQIRLQHGDSRYKRVRELHKRGTVSVAELDSARKEIEIAKTALAAAHRAVGELTPEVQRLSRRVADAQDLFAGNVMRRDVVEEQGHADVRLIQERLPRTYGIVAPTGVMGVLQVIDQSKAGRDVKIRWRMIEPGAEPQKKGGD